MTFLAQLLALALPFALLERIPRLRVCPAPLLRQGFTSDVAYLLTSYAAGASVAVAFVVEGSRWLGACGLPRLASLELPLFASAPLALVALDLGNYLAHLALHRVDVLWQLHKVHHSSPRLDWLATFRSHVLEQTFRRLVAPLLLVLVGFPLDAIALAYAALLAFAIANHSNLRSWRALEAVFVTPRLHRLHHVPATSECNLGTVLNVWDRALGRLATLNAPPDLALGVPGEVESYPQGWWRQLREPLLAMLPQPTGGSPHGHGTRPPLRDPARAAPR